MKAELIAEKSNLIDFLEKCFYTHGYTPYVSDKRYPSSYNRVESVDREDETISIDTCEVMKITDIDDIILFESWEEDMPWDIREILKVVNKTNKNYEKLERIENVTKVKILLDCESVPVYVDDDDFDFDRFDSLLSNVSLVEWTKLKDKEFPI